MMLQNDWNKFVNRHRLPVMTTIKHEVIHDLMDCDVQKVTKKKFRNTLFYTLTAQTVTDETIEVLFQITLAEFFTFFKHGKPVGTLTKFPDTMLNHEDVTVQEKAVLDSFMDDLVHFLKKHHAKEILLF